jgi:CO dehydrogenase/acetyl-CoA synthase delta subunit
MDTKTLIVEAKARFNHNSAKAQLKDKYEGKLIVADQGGLWKADTQTLTYLYNTPADQDKVILIDSFDNPVKVHAMQLYKKLREVHDNVMDQWYNEWKELESKR